MLTPNEDHPCASQDRTAPSWGPRPAISGEPARTAFRRRRVGPPPARHVRRLPPRTPPAPTLPEDADSPSETRATLAPKAATGLDALLAMQGIEEDPTERPKRSVQHGRRALDVLDDLKIALLSGNFDGSTVSRLREASVNLKSSSGDPGLDAVLSEIELRVEVELAKAGQH